MRPKFGIPFLLLAIYLFVMVVPAVVSLSCPCTARAAQGKGCGCCGSHTLCCAADHHHAADIAILKKGCSCNHSHDTEIELYTLPSTGEERQAMRCVVFSLPAVIGCEASTSATDAATLHHMRLRPVSGGDLCCLPPSGLRAPPVCA